MPAETYVKAGGVWRKLTAPAVRVGGTWRPWKGAWVKVGGVWQPVYRFRLSHATTVTVGYGSAFDPGTGQTVEWYGYDTTGIFGANLGAIGDATTDDGKTIVQALWYSQTGFKFALAGAWANNDDAFAAIQANGVTYFRANATSYVQLGGNTFWEFGGVGPPWGTSGTYSFIVNP